jgi:hypothetical protein
MTMLQLSILIEVDGPQLNLTAMSRSTTPAESEDVLDALISAAVEIGQEVGVSKQAMIDALTQAWED